MNEDSKMIFFLVGIPIAVLIFVIVVKAKMAAKAERERKEAIFRKYGHNEIAHRIIEKTIWVGETETQLRDSLGAPVDTDQKVLKTRSRVIWKYAHQGGNRYGLRITVDDGVVAGWDEKL